MSKNILGIEFGSTRIKAVMIDDDASILAEGCYEWENQFIDGYWTYCLQDVWKGLQQCYKNLNQNYKDKYSDDISEISAIGISAMMHGYLAFDKEDNILVPFRTWRNTTTERAANELSEKFNFNVPQRWSVSHYYQAVLDGEEHIRNVDFLTTLAGYVHYKLTGKKVIGIGDASGMFPIKNNQYNPVMIDEFNKMISEKGMNINFEYLLPEILIVGENAGNLTEEGAKLIDPSGKLKSGIVFCPPEGDAQTGMTATNCVMPKTANVSAGTSAFLMAVLEKEFENYYKEIDIVTTPVGNSVAMVHVNNFTSEMNAWAEVFEEFAETIGVEIPKSRIYDVLFKKSLESDKDIGKIVGYNFLSGEHIVGIEKGRPMFFRLPEGKLTLANFMQMHIYSALGSLSMGMDILKKENIKIEMVCGHGGFFKTEFVGQNAMSAAVEAPVCVMDNAGEGGAWGIAILALYLYNSDENFYDFLNELFKNAQKNMVMAKREEIEKFQCFMQMYKKGLKIEKQASEMI